ncbi:hypothetical protein PBY51_004595 [Eleginops maclovinus]|uniref:Uncharacterized protein n=2 Tax=Eleginops maclovinus TaxID=56733 RepID=A0AAN8AX94_ELEMC|nr:hypothetical protein PBY51_004595 [Eleginops maclovinus]
MSLMTPSLCGNGFLEAGEQCDCGTVEECVNTCCNATTCRLREGAQCAEGECCQDCQVSPRSQECRSKKDECDLAENCDGKSSSCPEDVFAVNGLPCDAGLGYCINGQCPQRPLQCIKLYGASAVEARPFCYKHNTRGTYYSFCQRPANDKFIPCQAVDIFCGKLFCEGGSGSPNYGRMVRVGECKAAFFGDYTKDYGQVDTGTKCGDGKVCSQNECVELQTAYRNTNCSAKCQGHAVCNHRSECQCEAGWMPPHCTSKEAYGGLSTGATVAIALTVILVVLGAIAGVVGFICKKRQSPMLPTSHTQRKLPVMHSQQTPVQVARKPKGAPPPPPPAGNRPKPPGQNYSAARQALRPVPPPKV